MQPLPYHLAFDRGQRSHFVPVPVHWHKMLSAKAGRERVAH
ncbi:hypothetical protein Lepto7375DRAFT_1993 [Leptolyngbya sp. PCC 7375]|nr:hypothetical protein Lepto7375DRAFT_1993 [Leptolyngbya sp. PCC 7375]